MIYFYMEKEKNILRPLYDTDGFSLLNWLRLPESFFNLKNKFFDAKYVWFPEEACPTVSLGTGCADEVEYNNATKVYRVIENQMKGRDTFPEERMDAYLQKCEEWGYNAEIAKKLLEFSQLDLICRKKPLDFPYGIDLGECDIEKTSGILDMIATHNKQFSGMLSSIGDADNVTLTQKNETDELFIEIPDLSLLPIGQEISWEKLIPPMAKVFTPYSDPAAYSVDYKSKVAKHVIPLIEGNPDKNGMSIQENERNYYDALCEWVQINMKNEFGSDEMDVIDNVSKSYLTELAFRLYARNWRHNSNIPISIYDDPEDDEQGSDDEGSSTVDSKYAFAKDLRKDDEINNAFLALESFLEKASAKVGWTVYVQAVIQLARWGERKGTAIKFEGFDYIFDLATNTGKYNIGSLDDYKLQLINGKEYDFLGWMITTEEPQDSKLSKIELSGIPIGLVVGSKFVKETEEIEVKSYYSMFDAVPLLQAGKLVVNGITSDLKIEKEAEYFSLKDAIQDYQGNTDLYLRNPFIGNETVRNLFLEFKIGKGKEYQSLLVILEQALENSAFTEELQQYKMRNLAEAKQKVARLELIMPNALEVNVASTLISVIEKVDALNEDTLEAWEIALKDWKGVDSFWESVGDVKKQEGGMKQLTAFGEDKPREKKPGTNTVTSQVVVQIPVEAPIHAVIDFKGQVIGGFTTVFTNRKLKNGGFVQKFILLNLDEYQAIETSRRSKIVDGREVPIGAVPIQYFIPKMIDAFLDINTGKALRLGFSSAASMNYYRKVMDTLFGKGGELDQLTNK